MNTTYQHLFSPFKLNGLSLPNRLVKAAQWTVFASPEGEVTDRLIGFYDSLAAGGVGLVTVEESVCDYPLGASNKGHLRLDEDRFIPGLKKLADAIHKHGVPAIVQITHAGPAHAPFDGSQPVAPSRLDPPVEPVFAVAKELSVAEIKALIEKFAQAALRVKKAGFDGAEIHMAHYALINAFLSRIQNKRTDEYGCGSLENRARFSVESLQRARELCGPGFVLGVRMNGREWGHELGTTREEAAAFARLFRDAGAQYLQVSAYGYGPFALCALPDLIGYPEVTPEVKNFYESIPSGVLIEDAAYIRNQAGIPVSGVGYIEPGAAEDALGQGRVDMICLGRPLLVDPQLPNKLKGGQPETIRPCLRCNTCLSNILLGLPVQCRMNAFLGNETEMKIEPAEHPKNVLVIGAGPAGLEAARVMALRGHHVEVYDRSYDLGGMMPMAAFIKGVGLADNLMKAIQYYRQELNRLNVPVHLGKQADVELVKMHEPDVVVLATGGKAGLPCMEGVEQHFVTSTESLKRHAGRYLHLLGSRAMAQLSKVYLPIGKSVIVLGGNYPALEAAEFLVKRGRAVTIVCPDEQVGNGMPVAWLARLLPWLAAHKVEIFTGAKAIEITETGVEFDSRDGERIRLEAKNVMEVCRYEANDALLNELKAVAPEVYRVGDANGDGLPSIQKAIAEGARLAVAV